MIFDRPFKSFSFDNKRVIKYFSSLCRSHIVDFTAGLVLSRIVQLCELGLYRIEDSSRKLKKFCFFVILEYFFLVSNTKTQRKELNQKLLH